MVGKSLILSTVLLGLSTVMTLGATIGYWTAEGNSHQSSVTGLTTTASSSVAYSSEVVGPQIFDPITGLTRSNTSSFNFSSALARLQVADHASLDQSSFTWEFFINLKEQPNSWDTFLTRKASGLGYQIDFDHSTLAAFGNVRTRWDTSPTSGASGNNRTAAGGKIYVDQDDSLKVYTQNTQVDPWHHVAMTWDASTKTFQIYTDYQLITSQTTNGPLFDTSWLAGVDIGKSNSGTYGLLMDEIRFSSAVLGTDDFLRVVPEPSKAMLTVLGLTSGLMVRRRKRA